MPDWSARLPATVSVPVGFAALPGAGVPPLVTVVAATVTVPESVAPAATATPLELAILNAVFQTLPGASFTVFGVPIARDSALTTAGAQLFLTQSWSLLAKFDGEFGSGLRTYVGTGTLRHTW